MAYCEELEAPAALDKGKCVLPGERVRVWRSKKCDLEET